MKTVLAAILVLASSAVMAAGRAPASSTSGGDNEITPALGFTEGAVNVGVEYERRDLTPGWGGYFFFQSEKDENQSSLGGASGPVVNQVIGLGGQAKFHLLDNSKVDVYMAPGAGIIMVKDVAKYSGGTTDSTTLGPSLRFGAMWNLSSNIKLGVTYLAMYNWFDDKDSPLYTYSQAALGIDF